MWAWKGGESKAWWKFQMVVDEKKLPSPRIPIVVTPGAGSMWTGHSWERIWNHKINSLQDEKVP